MKDERKTKKQLIQELNELRQEVSETRAFETGRKQPMQELIEREQRFRNTLDSMLEGCQILDHELRYVYVNDAAVVQGRVARKEKLGRTMMEVYPGIEGTEVFAAFQKCLEEGTPHRIENKFTFPNGQINWFEISMVPIPEGIFLLSLDINQRMQVEEQIKATLREKEVLLQEIHHRVMNNLAIVFNLLEWQAEMIEEQPARAAFQDSQNRLQTMARIHEHLYRSHDLSRVKIADFVQELKDFLCQSYGTSDITFKVDMNDIALEVEIAIPLGLIINELVSNSLKHAFPRDGQRPAALVNEVCITLELNNGEYKLTVRDNGGGLPIDLDLESVKSLGLSLVHMLSKQLRGRLEVDRVEGTTFRLTFAAPERRSLDDGK